MRKTSAKQINKKYLISCILLLITIATLTSFAIKQIFFNYDNFHTVLSHNVYRSARLSPAYLDQQLKKLAIRSIINLEGGQLDRKWYRNELQISENNSVQHYDIALNPHKLPSQQQLLEIIDLLNTAPKPILIHCKHGIDRSGLVSAISLILFSDPSIHAIKKQLSWRYKNFSPNTIGYQVMRNYLSWLQEQHLAHTRENFLHWANSKQPFKKNYFGWTY